MDGIDLRSVIDRAKEDDQEAKGILVKTLIKEGYTQQLNRYLHRNRLLDPEDIQSEFWIGVIQSIPKVSNDIGNPLQFLTFKGLCNVKSVMRIVIKRKVFYTCYSCGSIGNIQHHDRKCPKCQSENIHTLQYEINQTETISEPVTLEMIEEILIKDRIAQFKRMLTEREVQIVELIIDEGYTPQACTNYLREIGDIIMISPQRVSQYIGRIRSKYKEFIDENQY